MARKPTDISILQVGERALSALRVRPTAKGLHVLAHHHERGDWPAEQGALRTALRAFVQRHKLHHDTIYTVLPRHEMTTRILTLPSHEIDEVRGMIRLSAEEHVPFSLAELVLDACILQRLADGYARVLAVFVHRDVVNAHVALLEGAGLEPDRILVSSACLATAALAADVTEHDRYALVNLTAGGLEALVLRGARLEYDRGVASNLEWDARDSDAIEELALETRASLAAYRRESEDGAGVDAVYLSADEKDPAALTEALAARLDVPCVANRFARRLVTRGGDTLAGTPLTLLGAALTAQSRGAVDINLVPESLVQARKRHALKRRLVQGAAVAALALCGAVALFVQAYMQRVAYLAELRARQAVLEPDVEAVEAMEAQLAVLGAQVNRAGDPLELLAVVSESAPPDVSLTEFAFRRGESLRVTGRALYQDAVYALTERLRNAGVPELGQARRGDLSTEREYEQAVTRFEIVAPFPQPASSGGAISESFDEAT